MIVEKFLLLAKREGHFDCRETGDFDDESEKIYLGHFKVVRGLEIWQGFRWINARRLMHHA